MGLLRKGIDCQNVMSAKKGRRTSIVNALIDQVRKATPKGGSERDVRTYITRPMWEDFLVALGMTPEKAKKTKPTEWQGKDITQRVYGSQTFSHPRKGEGFLLRCRLVNFF